MTFGENLSLQVMLANKSYQQFLLNVVDDIDTYQHVQVLLMLNRKGGQCSQKDLCIELQIEKSYMVSIINSLLEKGYLFKETDYKDRRSKLISLSPKAVNVTGMLTERLKKFTELMSQHISWQDMHNCLSALKVFNDQFNEILANGDING